MLEAQNVSTFFGSKSRVHRYFHALAAYVELDNSRKGVSKQKTKPFILSEYLDATIVHRRLIVPFTRKAQTTVKVLRKSSAEVYDSTSGIA